MIRRHLRTQILQALKHFPVLLLTGARQVGKSTLVQSLIGPSWKARYLTLDDRAVLDAALRDPDGWINANEPPLVIDEVQKAPDLMRAIKRVVDRDHKPGQYLLTGSADHDPLQRLRNLSRPCGFKYVVPFQLAGISGEEPPAILKNLFEAKDTRQLLKTLSRSPVKEYRKEIGKMILSGGYPTPTPTDSLLARAQWFDSYRQTYLERDLLQIKAIENIPDFNRLLVLAAFRTGGLLNLSDLSRESGLPFSTLRRYMNLLEVTYQIFLLRPYHANIGKRLVKTLKLYFSDTGMASYLRGADHWSALERQGKTGAMVETWVCSELIKLIASSDFRMQIFFWRTQTGSEVDFLLEHSGESVALEVKWSHKIEDSAITLLKRCADDLKERLRLSVILYGGTEVVPLTPKMIAIPFPVFFGIV